MYIGGISLLQVAPAPGGGVAGVDPKTDPDFTLLWKKSGVQTDGDGVFRVDEDGGGTDDWFETTGGQKPASTTDGWQGDGINDRLNNASGFLARMIDLDGYLILAVLKTPASISTDSTTSFSNEGLLADTSGLLGIYFRSGGPEIGAYHFDTDHRKVEIPISLSTRVNVAVRYDGVNFGIALDGGSFTETPANDLNSTSLTTAGFMLTNFNASAFSTVEVAYLAGFDATKSNAEWVAFNTFLDTIPL